MASQNDGSSRRSAKSDEASKKGKALQRAIRKTVVKERPTLGKPVINDPVPKSKADQFTCGRRATPWLSERFHRRGPPSAPDDCACDCCDGADQIASRSLHGADARQPIRHADVHVHILSPQTPTWAPSSATTRSRGMGSIPSPPPTI